MSSRPLVDGAGLVHHGPVLHLVGRVTDTVFSFLGPATTTLAKQGVAQTVVMVDDPMYRHLLPRFHESVRLVLTSATAPQADRVKELLDAYCDAVRARRPSIAHLHGTAGSVLGVYAAWFRGVTIKTCLTPHGSLGLPPWSRAVVAWLRRLRPLSGGLKRAIANSRFDAETLSHLDQPVDVIESPVAEPFFEMPLCPTELPSIVTASWSDDPVGAARFAQCAVLVADLASAPSFQWLGMADRESMERLKAARVTLGEVGNDAQRARRLAAAWVYIASASLPGFPVFVAEAMALGLPCVAWDTPNHRDLLRHGETGFLCRDSHQALAQLAALLASAELRQQIGDAARAEARARFDVERFSDSLLGAYGAAEAL